MAAMSPELRQEFLSIYVPRIRELGLLIPDPALRRDDDTGRWEYTEPAGKLFIADGKWVWMYSPATPVNTRSTETPAMSSASFIA